MGCSNRRERRADERRQGDGTVDRPERAAAHELDQCGGARDGRHAVSGPEEHRETPKERCARADLREDGGPLDRQARCQVPRPAERQPTFENEQQEPGADLRGTAERGGRDDRGEQPGKRTPEAGHEGNRGDRPPVAAHQRSGEEREDRIVQHEGQGRAQADPDELEGRQTLDPGPGNQQQYRGERATVMGR